jgi:hypothetical protein
MSAAQGGEGGFGPGVPELQARFRAYTAPFLDEAGDGRPNVQLKIDHTMRVFELAARIADEERFAPEEAYLARVGGLFHDTGRFPQYRGWGVFNDAASANHARLGVRALVRENLLKGLSRRRRGLVLGAVALHNRRSLPPNLPPLLDRTARAVRDADKLDIYPVMLAHLDGSRPPNKVVTLGITPHPDNYTPSMLGHIEAGRIAPYAEMRWHNDFKLLVLSWIYDINFRASMRLLHERGHVEAVMRTLPRTPELDRVRGRIRKDLAARL